MVSILGNLILRLGGFGGGCVFAQPHTTPQPRYLFVGVTESSEQRETLKKDWAVEEGLAHVSHLEGAGETVRSM